MNPVRDYTVLGHRIQSNYWFGRFDYGQYNERPAAFFVYTKNAAGLSLTR